MRTLVLILFLLACGLTFVNRADAANIIWASLVSDTDPVTPDQPFLDLLTSSGHNVTRFEIEGAGTAPLSSGNIDLLNMSDLVILGRGNASGNFQDADANPWNEEVTTPVMVMSAYLIRTNRMGWQAGNGVPDSGPTPLVAADPNHPVFNGISFAADGVTMANDYNIMVDRGITTMGEPPVAGGIVIATNPTLANGNAVAIAEWPTGTLVTPDNANAAPLAGPRYFFAGGSREADGASIQDTAGTYDLTDDGARLFTNFVDYILGTEPPVPGDFNDDGVVNNADYDILVNNLGGHLDGQVGRAEGDLNFDGQVDLDDFGQFKDLFPGALGQAAAVPEPASLALLAVAGGALALTRVRRSRSAG